MSSERVDPRAFKKHDPEPETRTKICPGCGDTKKYPDDFYLQKKRARKRESRCKACKATAYREWAASEKGRANRLASQMKYLATAAGQASLQRMIEKRRKLAQARRKEKLANKKKGIHE